MAGRQERNVGNRRRLGWMVKGPLLGCLWAVLGVVNVGAQYNSPVGLGANVEAPSKDRLESAYEEARWSFGPLRAQPWLGVRDASIVTLQERQTDGSIRETDDFTATAGAGIRLYARSSPKLVFAAHALPEYVWWQDDENKRGVNGRYGAGLFGYFNRLSVELSLRRVERQDIFSSEVQQLTSSRLDRGRLRVGVEAIRGVDVYVMAESNDYSGNEDDLSIFRRLDRREDELTVGVRAKTARGYIGGIGYRDLETEFDSDSRSLSNEGSSFFVELGVEREKFSVTLDADRIDLEPTEGSVALAVDEWTHHLDLVWLANRALEMQLYSRRDFEYAVFDGGSHWLRDRVGVVTRLKGGRSFVDFIYAVGEDDLEGLADGFGRVDDVTELRATLSVPLGDLLSLSIYGQLFDYDSNIDAFDRELSTYGLAIDLGKLASRLSLGKDEGIW